MLDARYGWIPDRPDHRDKPYLRLGEPSTSLPPIMDLRGQCPSVYDQGNLGSCTANALAAAFTFVRMRQPTRPALTPSRLFIYYNERRMEGTINSDAGAMIRDGLKSIGSEGVCDEIEWPYDIERFSDEPGPDCYYNAKLDMALTYSRLDNTKLSQLRGCLAAGFPFVFGFSVYESFESETVAQTGVVDLPTASEGMVGGHAVLAVGYVDADKRFLVRNSWGPGWGLAGYYWMPYEYLTNPDLADDFWTIRAISP